MAKAKLIIFDWDDVFVVGAIQGYYACYKQALLDVGVEVDEHSLESVVKEMWGRPHAMIIERLLGPSRSGALEEAVDRYQAHKRSEVFLGQLKFVNRGQEFLQKIHNQYTLAIATSQERDVLLDKVFPAFGVPNVFSEIMTLSDLDDPKKAKPHPYMLNYLLGKFDLKPDQAVMVGDAANDVKMAQSAGVRPIVVLSGHLDRKQAEELGVKDIVETVLDIESVL